MVWKYPRILLFLLLSAFGAEMSAASIGFGVLDHVAFNGSVFAVTANASTIYVGGNFSSVGPAIGQFVPVNSATGVLQSGWPVVAGTVVRTAIPDGSGGWYVGGQITGVSGQSVSRVAHILSTGSPDPSFVCTVGGGSNGIYALALSGGTLYLGGDFTTVNGASHQGVAAVSASTGANVGGFSCDVAASFIYALAVVGSDLIIGGQGMTTVNGTALVGSTALTRVNATTGALGSGSDNPRASKVIATHIGAVYAIAPDLANSRVIVAGDFDVANNVSGVSSVVAYDSSTYNVISAFTSNAHVNYNNGGGYWVNAVTINAGTVYVAGPFSHVGGTEGVNDGFARAGLAAFNSDGTVKTAFTADLSTGANTTCLAIEGTRLIAGGNFTTVNGSPITYVAAVNLGTGALDGSFLPQPNQPPLCLAVKTGTVFIGGSSFDTVNGSGATARNCLAAIDASTGTLVAGFNPNVTGGQVNALVLNGSTLYAGGTFTTVNGSTSRTRVAAFNTANGVATAFDVNADNTVQSMAYDSGSGYVYLGGLFNNLNGSTAKAHLGAVNATTGAVISGFTADVTGTNVTALYSDGSKLYVGGQAMTAINGTTRNRLGAVDLSTGAVDGTFDPNITGTSIQALLVTGSTVYAGGTAVTAGGGLTRNALLSLNKTTGVGNSAFDAGMPTQSVRCFGYDGSRLYVGGTFTSVNSGAFNRGRFVALDPITGADLGLDVQVASGAVISLARNSNTYYLGGTFSSVGAQPKSDYAALTISAAVSGPTVSSLSFNSAAISGTAGLVITGTGFTAPLTVTVKGVDSASFAINSATQITAQVPANTAGSGNVIVTSASGSSSAGASNAFTYAAGNIVVNTATDVLANDGQCGLREAAENANTNSINGRNKAGECGGGTGTDTIVVPAVNITLGSDLGLHSDLTLSGSGAGVTTIDGFTSFGISVTAASNVTIQGLFLTRARQGGSAAIFAQTTNLTLTVQSCRIFSSPGFGINAGAGTSLVVQDSSIESSTSVGIVSSHDLTLRRSSVVDGLQRGVTHSIGGNALLEDSTIDNNSSDNVVQSFGTMTIDHCTISGSTGAAGLRVNSGATAIPKNSLFYNNFALRNFDLRAGGTLTSGGSNTYGTSTLSGTHNLPFTGDLTTDPLLQARTANGGLGETRSLGAGSPAIDSANAATTLTTDQTGAARSFGAGRDRGAYEVVVDSANPTITITSPTSAATFPTNSSTIGLGGTASDNVSVASVSWANSTNSTSGSATGTTSWSVPSINLAAGPNVIVVTATDTSGNSSTDTITVTRDNSNPTVTITSPTSSATYLIGASTINLGGTASDNVSVASVSWEANGVDTGTATGTTSWSAASIPLGMGANTIIVTATDTSGNVSTDTITVTRFGAPTVTGLSESAFCLTGSASIVITGTDFYAPLTVTVKGVDSSSFVINSPTQITAQFPANTAGAGRVVITNSVGASADVAADDVTYAACDSTPPSFGTTYPLAGSSVNTSTPHLTFNYSDSGSGVDASSVVLMLDGVTVTPATPASATSVSYQVATPLSLGLHSVAIYAADNAANAAGRSFTFTVSDSASRFHVGAGQEYATLTAAFAAIKAAETALGGGAAPFNVTRTVDVHAGSYTGSYLLNTAALGGVPSASAGLVIRHSDPTVHPVLSDGGSGYVFNLQVPYVTVDGFDLKSGNGDYAINVGAGNALITRNYFDSSTGGGAIWVWIPGAGTVIAGNAFMTTVVPTNSGGSTVQLDGINVQFTNNTLWSTVDHIQVSIQAVPAEVSSNIFYDPGAVLSAGNTLQYFDWIFLAGLAPLASENNIFYNGTAPNTSDFILDGSGTHTLSAYQALHPGLEAGSLDTNPGLTGSGSGAAMFKLSTGSPAINMSSSLYGLAYDYFGVWRNPDVGFSEYVFATTVKPVLLNPYPAAGATNVAAAKITINASIQDPGGSGIDQNSVAVVLDGVELIRSTSATYVSAPTDVLATGLHHVSVDVKDNAGNSANQLNWSFVVGPFGQALTETTAPIISGAYPTGSSTNTLPVIFVSVTDGASALASGVSLTSVSLRLDGSVVPATVTAGSSSVSITFTPLSALALGAHHVSLDVNDIAGNSASTYAWTFNVIAADNVAPLISNPAPAGITVALTGTVITADYADGGSGIDVSSVVVTVDGVVVPATATATSITYNAPTQTAGTHLVTVDVKDLAGNAATQLLWSYDAQPTDTTAPSVGSFSPAAGSVTTNASPLVWASLADSGSGVNSASIITKVDGVIVTHSASASAVTINAGTLSEGTHVFSIELADLAGNQATPTLWSFEVSSDTAAPTFGAYGPVGVTNSARPVVYAKVTDTASGVSATTVVVRIDGSVVGATLSAATATGIAITFTPSTDLAQGDHTVSIDATDKVGHAATQLNFVFTVSDDLSVPVISAGSPTGVTSNANTLITAHLADNGSGIDTASVVLSLDGNIQAGAVNDGVTVSFTASALADGLHTVNVDVKDLVGNAAVQSTWHFTVASDTAGPVLSNPSPTGLTMTGTSGTTISASFSDALSGVNLSSVSMTVDGEAVPAIVGAGTVSYSPAIIDIGTHTVTLDAKDNAGNPANQLVWSFTSGTLYCVGPPPSTLAFSSSFYIGTGQAVRDASGNYYVIDAFVPRLDVYDAGGFFSYFLPLPGQAVSLAMDPTDILVVNVSVGANSEIYRMDTAGTVLPGWPVLLPLGVTGVATDGAGNVYVANNGDSTPGHKVHKYDGAGNLLLAWGSAGNGNGKFATLTGITVDSAGAVYVADSGKHRVQKFNGSNGNFIRKWGTQGSNNGQFETPSGIAASPAGVVFVADSTLERIQAFDLNGVYQSQIGFAGAANGQFNGLSYISYDHGDLMTQDSGNFRLQLFTAGGSGVCNKFDTVPPVISGAVPAGGSVLSTNTPLIWAAFSDLSPGAGIDASSIVATVDGVSVPYIATATAITVTPGALSEGVHTVTLNVSDFERNVATQLSWQFTVQTDLTTPVVNSVSAPVAADYLTVTPGSTINVTYDYTEDRPAYVSITVRSGATVIGTRVISAGLLPNATRTDTVTLSSTAATGTYDVQVDVVDLGSLTGTASSVAALIVDATKPLVDGVNSQPLPGANIVDATGTTEIAFYLSDAGGAGLNSASVKLLLDGSFRSPLSIVPTGTGLTVSYTAAGLSTGNHSATVSFADLVGNVGLSRTLTFTVQTDVAAPTVSAVYFPSLAASITVAAGATINVSYDYQEANPAYVSITVRSGASVIGSKVISSGLQPNASRTDSVALIGAPQATTGVYDILVSVVDAFGQAGSLTFNASVDVDATVPTASATVQPVAASTVIDVNGNTDIAAFLSDAGGAGVDPASVKLLLDGSFRTPTVTANGTGYSVSYTATGLATGTHSVTVSYADLVGNAGVDKTWTFNVVRDNTAPVVSAVSAPTTALPITVAAGATISVSYAYTEVNPAYISITVRSGANVIGATVISSGLLPNASRTDVVALVSSPTAATGVFDVLVSVVDSAGQAGSLTSNASVIVDNTLPTISATVIPVGGSTVIDTAGFTSITAYVADAGGAGIDPSSVKLFLDGAYKNGATVVASGTGYTLTFTTGGGNALAAGLHSVSVTYADRVGNVGLQKNWSFTMVRDNTAPVISAISSPTSLTPAYTHASGTVDVLWSYVETNPAWVSITVRSGGTIVGQTVISSGLASAPSIAQAMTTSVDLFNTVAQGAYDVQVTMQDSANQQGTLNSATSVVVDNTKPVAAIGAPLAGSIQQTSSPVITANLSDAGGSAVEVGSIVMRLDGSIVPATTSATLAQYTASGLADGLHTVDVDLNDRANNAATRLSWSFRTDISVPSISLTAPFEGAYVRGNIPVEALSSDAGSGVTRTAFFYGSTFTATTAIGTSFFNGSGWNDGSGVSPSASTRWNTAIGDGAYYVYAQAVDLVGNTGTSSQRHIIIDNTAPVLAIDPVNSPTQFQAQTITGQLVEMNVASLSVNGIGATLNGSAPNYTWTCVVPLVSGANAVTITAVDLVGLSVTANVSITYDPTATVHFLAPVFPGDYKGQVEIEGSAPSTARWVNFQVSADNQATWNSVSLNASVAGIPTTLTKTTANGWRLSWNTIADGLADGSQYYLRMAAFDQYNVNLGNSTIGPFTTDNVAPVESFSIAPLPDLNGGNSQVYDPNVTVRGSVTETGSGVARLVLEQFNSSGNHVGNSPVDLPVLTDGLFSRNVILIQGYNRLKVTVTDKAGNASSFTSVVYYLPPKSSGTICSSGGSVAAPDHTQILIPNGAFITCQDVSIFTVDRILLASPANPLSVIVGQGHLIKPEAQVLQAQATVILPYTNADLDPDANGTPDYIPANLKVLFWDGTLWQNVGVDDIDTVNQRVTVRTNHLGLFALASDTTPLPGAPKVYLTKNPFRFGVGEPTSFVYDMPQPGKVTIRIFDMTGDPVRVLVDKVPQLKGRFTQVWDGLNNFDRFVGSGAYVFRFEAEYDDGSKTTVTKAIGVLK